MEQSKVKYCLFAIPYSEEAQEEARKHRFNRINSRYILIYDRDEQVYSKIEVYHIIDKSEIGFLSEAEKKWLFDCNVQIINEISADKQDEILKSFSMKLEQLEKELEKESAKVDYGQD